MEQRYFLFDTRRRGEGNGGHLYGTNLPPEEPSGYLERWLIVTGVLFVTSLALYVFKLTNAERARAHPERTGSSRPRP